MEHPEPNRPDPATSDGTAHHESGHTTSLEQARAYLARQASNDSSPKAFIHETRKHALELLLHQQGTTDDALARLLTQATDRTTFNRITSPLYPGPCPREFPPACGNT